MQHWAGRGYQDTAGAREKSIQKMQSPRVQPFVGGPGSFRPQRAHQRQSSGLQLAQSAVPPASGSGILVNDEVC